VLVAWGYTTEGKRVLVAVRLGQRESHEDWLDLAAISRGADSGHPGWLVSDGAPGLIKASTSSGRSRTVGDVQFTS